jgi:hypothetical protein
VPQETFLDVFELERLLQERIVLEIDHARAQVQARPPIGVDLAKLLCAERALRYVSLRNL